MQLANSPADSPRARRLAKSAAWLAVAVVVAGLGFALRSRLAGPDERTLLEYGEDSIPPNLRGQDRELAWKEFFATQSVILGSRTICERAAQELLSRGLLGRSQKGSQEADSGAARDRLASEIQQGLRVERLPDSRLVSIAYRDQDPRRAAAVADAVAEAYVARVEATRQASNTGFGFLGKELEGESPPLDEVRVAVEQFILQRGGAAGEADRGPLSVEISRFVEAVTEARIRLVQLQAQASQLEAAIAKERPYSPRVDADPVCQGLKAQLVELTRARAESQLATPVDERLAAKLELQFTLLTKEQVACARRVLDELRVELAVARDQEKQLATALAMSKQQLAEFDLRALEWRRLQRALAAGEARAEAESRSGARARPLDSWRVRVVERASHSGR